MNCRICNKKICFTYFYFTIRGDEHMNIGERIKYLRVKMGWTQKELSERIGISRPSIAKYETNARLPNRHIEKLSEIFDVTTDYLLCKSDNPVSENKENKIPVFEKISAETSFETTQSVEDYEVIPIRWGNSREYFALRIRDHSMEPRIWNGDIVIVHKQNDVDSGEIAVVLVNGCEATVKQIKKSTGGLILIGFNPSVYQPHFYTSKEVRNFSIRIIGHVEEVRGKP